MKFIIFVSEVILIFITNITNIDYLREILSTIPLLLQEVSTHSTNCPYIPPRWGYVSQSLRISLN